VKSESDIRAEWLALLHSTAAADRPRAEAAVRKLYAAAGFAAPAHAIWFDSPCPASWAVAALVAPYHHVWAQNMASVARSIDGRKRLDAVKATLVERLGAADWNQALSLVSSPLGMHLQFPPDPTRILQSKIFEARYGLSGDPSSMFTVRGDSDDLSRAEQRFWGSNKGVLRSALHCPTTDSLVGFSFFDDYSFSTMADDQFRVGDREPPAIMAAAWDVARSAGMWWPFENAAILTERPTELHVDDRKLLHNGDGPAAAYPDGWRVYAWSGIAFPEQWILHPETIPPKELKHLDPSFRKHAASRTGLSAAKPPKKRLKPAAILSATLPDDHAARLERLRADAGGRLPFFERYQAGDVRQVWADLVALGADVRQDPHAADALAVAYETMRRVDANVRTIVQRLTAMKYAFTTDAAETGAWRARTKRTAAGAHVPPVAGVRRAIADFEKEAGALPLSLRAFYEVVGEVNLIGDHPTLAPRDGEIATDPLVVFAFDPAAADLESDDGDGGSAITIAPDALHKADTSGGDPYEIAIPDPRADGELLNERHGLLFVDYLRLCFRYGGFPGYDGAAEIRADIKGLNTGLIEF